MGKYACRDLHVLRHHAEPLVQRASQAVSHSDLKDLAKRSTYRVYPLRYQDPPEIKDLCRLRSVTGHGPERARLTGLIYKQRREAKQQWTNDLFSRASQGDWQARQALQRPKVKKGGLLHYSSTKTDARMVVEEVREYFKEKFGSGPTCQSGPFPWDADASAEHDLPSVEEIHLQVSKMKRHKPQESVVSPLIFYMLYWKFPMVIRSFYRWFMV